MSFIAKVALISIQDNVGIYQPNAGNGGSGQHSLQTFSFKPVTDHSDVPEDKHFSLYTPTSGSSIVLDITNPKVQEEINKLGLGQRYYVTFEPVPEGK